MSKHMTVHLAVGEPRPDWCDRCLTSAAVDMGVYALMPDGPIPVGSIGFCTECDADTFNPVTAVANAAREVERALLDRHSLTCTDDRQ